jgi:hypothetical protein
MVAAVVGVVAAGRHDTAPSASERAAAERARLAKLHREQVRLRAAARRDPVLRRERARLRVEQRAHRGRARPGFGSRAGQDALVGALERSITRDANQRFHAGALDKPTLETQCVRFVRPQRAHVPPPPLSARVAGYECTAATVKLKTSVSRTGTAILGFPFWARVDFATGRFAWCKINLLPSEHGIGDSLAFVPLPAACDLLKSGGPA